MNRAPSDLPPSDERYRALLEITNTIVSNLTRDTLFHAVSVTLGRVVAFDRATLNVYEAARDLFHVFGLGGTDEALGYGSIGEEIGRQGSDCGWVFERKQPLLRGDLERERLFPTEETLFTDLGIRSHIVVPLVCYRGKILGTLNVGSRTPFRYSDDHVLFLEQVAKQIALVMENVNAYQEVSSLKTELEQQNIVLQEEIRTDHNFVELIGTSRAIKAVVSAAEDVAKTDTTVLLLGETGTGKELVARGMCQRL